MESQCRWSHQAIQSPLCLSLKAQSTSKPTSRVFCEAEESDRFGWRRRRQSGAGLWYLPGFSYLRIKVLVHESNCTLSPISPICWHVDAWVSTCCSACVCLELLHQLKSTHWSVSVSSSSSLTPTRCMCQSQCWAFAAYEIHNWLFAKVLETTLEARETV